MARCTSSWVSPDTQGTVYAVCYVKESDGAARGRAAGWQRRGQVWVNRGAPIINSEALPPAVPEQHVAGAELLAGWNRLLVKLSAVERPFALTLRLSAPMARRCPVRRFSPVPRRPVPTGRCPKLCPTSVHPGSARAGPARSAGSRAGKDAAARAQACSSWAAICTSCSPATSKARRRDAARRVDGPASQSPDGLLLAAASTDHNDKRRALEGPGSAGGDQDRDADRPGAPAL